jgi:hypothetical protein
MPDKWPPRGRFGKSTIASRIWAPVKPPEVALSSQLFDPPLVRLDRPAGVLLGLALRGYFGAGLGSVRRGIRPRSAIVRDVTPAPSGPWRPAPPSVSYVQGLVFIQAGMLGLAVPAWHLLGSDPSTAVRHRRLA